MLKKSFRKKYELFALGIGFSAVLCLTIILIINQGFYVGVHRFIPEGNPYIRYAEIVMGIITIPALFKIIRDKINNND